MSVPCSRASAARTSGPSGSSGTEPCTIDVETSARPAGAYSGAAAEITMVFAIGEPVGVQQQHREASGNSGAAW